MIIREARPDDLDGILAVERAAFESEAEAHLVAALVDDPAYVPTLSLVAEDAGRIVGSVLLTRLWVDGADGSVHELLSLAPLAVDPASQGHGIGSILAHEGIRRARGMGECAIVVLGHADFYPRFGFVPARPFGIEPPEGWEVPSEAWMALELEPGSLAEVSGTARFATPFLEVV